MHGEDPVRFVVLKWLVTPQDGYVLCVAKMPSRKLLLLYAVPKYSGNGSTTTTITAITRDHNTIMYSTVFVVCCNLCAVVPT